MKILYLKNNLNSQIRGLFLFFGIPTLLAGCFSSSKVSIPESIPPDAYARQSTTSNKKEAIEPLSKNENFNRSFVFHNNKHYLDLYDAARVILESCNVALISGGDRCTFTESDKFFSYRRDGADSGRMAHLVWFN